MRGMRPDEFAALLELRGMQVREVGDFCGVNRRTGYEWVDPDRRGGKREGPNLASAKLLALMERLDLSAERVDQIYEAMLTRLESAIK